MFNVECGVGGCHEDATVCQTLSGEGDEVYRCVGHKVPHDDPRLLAEKPTAAGATGIKAKVAALIARGAVQLSRKYRRLAVPLELPPGRTFLDELRERDPAHWQRLEEQARNGILYRDPASHIELSWDEFNEWLVQTGKKPVAGPPEPYRTWGEYWRVNNTHPGEVRRGQAVGEEKS